ncbi:uncharacterized protein G2W53_036645 [Senna tora]|uniref:Uncharacterized protein n=1 Tax=Senna tora TaxID=362788 RepID=A0A834W5B2_9FABA|nr:uncharacterized protein G2W53_036645 [Senna tora]
MALITLTMFKPSPTLRLWFQLLCASLRSGESGGGKSESLVEATATAMDDGCLGFN